jgi:hypothetical protein
MGDLGSTSWPTSRDAVFDFGASVFAATFERAVVLLFDVAFFFEVFLLASDLLLFIFFFDVFPNES